MQPYTLPSQNWTDPNGSGPNGNIFNTYSWAPNGSGGANYYQNGQGITNSQYGAATGVNYGQLEQYLAGGLNQNGQIGTAASTGPSGTSYGVTQQNNPAYDQYNSYLNNMYSLLDQNQASQNQQVGNNYDTSLSGINNDFQTGQDNLNQARTNIDQNQAKSLRDLSSNLRNSFQQGQNQLGNLGAGDSSAVDQYSYALTKSGNQSRGDLLQQTGNQRANVDMQQNALQRQQAQQISALNSWKSNALLNISSQYGQQRAQLEQLKMSAPAQYIQGVQALNNNVMSQLQQVDQAHQAQAAQLGAGLGNSIQGLDLSGTNIQPQNLSVAPLQGGLNFLQNTPNVSQLQSASPGNYLQGSTGTARVKQPWEY
jgi:hypothetical protein